MRWDAFAATDVGRTRATNEDSVLTTRLSDTTLLAVADGMGGHAAGDVASETALDAFGQAVRNAADRELSERLRTGIREANDAVRTAATETGHEGMGTTLVAALVSGHRVTVINVGDSRAYDVHADGIDQLTVDQTLVQELVDSGTLSETQVDSHPQRHVLAQALGTHESVDPDLYDHRLEGTVLLCSDGLTEELSDAEIHETVLEAPSLSAAAEQLIARANEAGGSDNISVVLAEPAT